MTLPPSTHRAITSRAALGFKRWAIARDLGVDLEVVRTVLSLRNGAPHRKKKRRQKRVDNRAIYYAHQLASKLRRAGYSENAIREVVPIVFLTTTRGTAAEETEPRDE